MGSYELLVGCIFTITAFSVFFNIPLYLMVLYAIFKHRKQHPFNSPFFLIFTALGVVDLLCYALFLFMKKPFFFGCIPDFCKPFNEPNFYLSLFYPAFYILAFLQYELLLLLNLNRFVCIVYPHTYFMYFQHKTTRCMIAFLCVLAALLCLPMVLHADATVVEYSVMLGGQNRTLYNGPTFVASQVSAYMSNVWQLHIALVMGFGLLSYSIMFLKTRQHTSAFIKSRIKPELRLLYMALVMFVINFGFAVYFVLRDHALTTNTHVHEWVLMIMSDVYDLPNGIVLLFTCKEIRNVLWSEKSCKVGSVVTSNNNNINNNINNNNLITTTNAFVF